MKSRSMKKGFTLIELLAVIAIIGILITLVSPQIGKARLRGKLTEQAVKGRAIVEAIMAKEAASRFSSGWPKSGDYANTAEFLQSLVEDGYLDVDYHWFAAPGFTPARSAEEFGPENCAWYVVADVDDTTPGNTPVVFLKNLNVSSMSFSDDSQPFGEKGFAFAKKNGEAVTVEKAEMESEDFEIIFKLEEGASTPILGL